jgi:acyl carrier protein
MQVVARIRDRLGAIVETRDIFETPTVAGLSVRIEGLRREVQRVPPPMLWPIRTPMEHAVVRIWSELLKSPVTSAAQNFWELGGNSLLATLVVASVRSTLGIDVPIGALEDAPTLREFSRYLDAAQARKVEEILQVVSRLSDEDVRRALAEE